MVSTPSTSSTEQSELTATLPGIYQRITPAGDIREIERLLGMEPNSIETPLWICDEQPSCAACHRAPTWLDVVASAVVNEHSRDLLSCVLRGELTYLNMGAPGARCSVHCYRCGVRINDLGDFECRNWRDVEPEALAALEMTYQRS
ncbi:MAG TPA: hypothetical protein VGD50_05110 [Candidatus Baltobacteraceae bacterium]